jgi:hypothetical protein
MVDTYPSIRVLSDVERAATNVAGGVLGMYGIPDGKAREAHLAAQAGGRDVLLALATGSVTLEGAELKAGQDLLIAAGRHLGLVVTRAEAQG